MNLKISSVKVEDYRRVKILKITRKIEIFRVMFKTLDSKIVLNVALEIFRPMS